MKQYLKKILLGNILVYTVYILLGIFLIYKTSLAINLISIALGVTIILSSLLAIIKFLTDGTKMRFYRWELFLGIFGLLLGLFIIFNPFDTFNLFIIGFGIWLVAEGLMKLRYSFFFKEHKEEIWPLCLGIGLASILLGIALIINPFTWVMETTKVLGVFVIASALLNIMYSMLYYKRISAIMKIFK